MVSLQISHLLLFILENFNPELRYRFEKLISPWFAVNENSSSSSRANSKWYSVEVVSDVFSLAVPNLKQLSTDERIKIVYRDVPVSS